MQVKKIFKDQMNRQVEIMWPPERIISLVPSQTELLYNLGLNEEVVGITKFCIHPETWFRTKQRVGGTKQLKLEKIFELKPDVIIANKEENEEQQIRMLSKDLPVWLSDIQNLHDALTMIEMVGELTNKINEAKNLSGSIGESFNLLHPHANFTACYLIWNNPMMTVNKQTFIHDMMHRCGLQNVFSEISHSRYPKITEEELKQENPQVLLLSSEPFPFSEKHIRHFQNLLPNTKVMLVNGEMFSWYGSRLLYAAPYFELLTAG